MSSLEATNHNNNAKRFVVFGAGAGPALRPLSNLADAPLVHTWPAEAAPWVPPHLRGRTAAYPSSEHAFQALRSLDLATARAFESGGALDVRADDAVLAAFPRARGKTRFERVDLRAKVAAYWGRRGCLGIVAKMAVCLPPAVAAAALGLRLGPQHPDAGAAALWVPLLLAKFAGPQGAAHRARLLACPEDALLVEGGRFRDPRQYWSAYVDRAAGCLIGHNRMGALLGRVRLHLRLDDDDE